MAKLRLKGDFDYEFLAKSTPGYVGADLSALTGAAGVIAVKRIFDTLGEEIKGTIEGVGVETEERLVEIVEGEVEESMVIDDVPIVATTNGEILEEVSVPMSTTNSILAPFQIFADLPPALASLPIATFLQNHPSPLTIEQLSTLSLTNSDFTQALTIVQPSSQREGFTTVPSITWSDLGALKSIREEMRMSIVRPIRNPEIFEKLGIMNPCGVLLWGPPGCGKTLLAKAVANESGANFISVKGPELLNKVRRLLL